MRQDVSPTVPVKPFIQKNLFAKKLSAFYLNTQLADIIFTVRESGNMDDESRIYESDMTGDNEQSEMTTNKDEENSLDVQLHAHRFILQACAPSLAELCEAYKDNTPIPIYGVTADIFKLALKYVYGIPLGCSEWKKNSKALIDAADRYALTGLKLEAEAWFVTLTAITEKNVIDLLNYADRRHCALLNEAAMHFLLKNKPIAHSIAISDNIPESGSFFPGLLAAISLQDQDETGNFCDNTSMRYETMSLNVLRMEAIALGLEIDGSRKLLVKRLEKYPEGKEK
eukprot:CAMPEP_0171387894 /NCGR_PEP_ID=MMETSP0879-20121228/40228_1 /TAXON_ID=67004 /ORGANISM="Thalassiosira weissflogii, Strain CCMP1336" /LENGTH=283 /DNA_ID=CAMNT_0011900229 /DNA_START=811 /DNA_END=1662 /DNA_ORIENTATION=+